MSRLSRPVAVGLATGVLLTVVGLPAGVAYAAYRHDVANRDVLPAGSRVGAVDVGGLTRAEAVAKVTSVVRRDRNRKAVLTVAGHTYVTSKRALGVRDNAEAAVDQAFEQSTSGSWMSRAWDRMLGHTRSPRVEVRVTRASKAKVAALATRAARQLAVAPVDAKVWESGGRLHFSDSKTGRRLDAAKATTALLASLADGKRRTLGLEVVQPEVPTSRYDTALLVRTGENRLVLYKKQQVARVFPVATGAPEYATPKGRFRVELKRYLPTWVNPGSEWARNEPAVIPPGPNNPLGTRALNISAPGIRIHGTPADRSIGYSVSHGCIRMHMRDVEALYPMVPTGAPVFIVSAGPPRVPPGGAASVAGAVADGG